MRWLRLQRIPIVRGTCADASRFWEMIPYHLDVSMEVIYRRLFPFESWVDNNIHFRFITMMVLHSLLDRKITLYFSFCHFLIDIITCLSIWLLYVGKRSFNGVDIKKRPRCMQNSFMFFLESCWWPTLNKSFSVSPIQIEREGSAQQFSCSQPYLSAPFCLSSKPA